MGFSALLPCGEHRRNRKDKIVLWIYYEMNAMYLANSERNRMIYELWEANLTVSEISSRTGIPRSTVGYYVRKFNKLGAQGKPVVFPGSDLGPRMPRNYTEDIPLISRVEAKVLASTVDGDWEGLYYRLSAFKLLKELGLLSINGQIIFLNSLVTWIDIEITQALAEKLGLGTPGAG